ncbi:hypothetical protein AZE42_04887, partial [Rhizopogon vesiculosus]
AACPRIYPQHQIHSCWDGHLVSSVGAPTCRRLRFATECLLPGYAVSLGMSGVCAGQMVFYMKTFVNDRKSIKLVVTLVFVVDLFHTYCTSALYWKLLVVCHRNDSPKCQIIPWELFAGILLACTLSLIVQCFYAHRVWIITDKNWKLTGSVLVTALVQYGELYNLRLSLMRSMKDILQDLELRVLTLLFHAQSSSYPDVRPLLLLCDLENLNVHSVLKPETRPRLSPPDSNNYIQQLIVISVQMGVFNSLVAIHFVQGASYWTAFPAAILCKLPSEDLPLMTPDHIASQPQCAEINPKSAKKSHFPYSVIYNNRFVCLAVVYFHSFA